MTQKILSATETLYPQAPVESSIGVRRISPEKWSAIANDSWQSITACISARAPLEANLRASDSVYELEVAEKNEPWVNCSNILVPMVPAKLETLMAQVASMVFVPEFYIVTGNTADAQEHAYEIQRYYNAEFRRQRGRSTWFEEHLKWLQLGLRDGTGIIEATWKYRKRLARFSFTQNKTGDDGLPFIDQETGEPVTERVSRDKEVIDYNDVNLRTILLKEFLLAPDESISIEEAAAVWRAEWFYEKQLKAMVRDGLMDEEWVERALAYVPQGTSDVASDRQGTYDKTIGGQIVVGQGQGALASKWFKNRGPIKVWRGHTDQFDMNDDGWSEENVLWIHDQSMYMLGWCPDGYIAPTRPFFAYSPFPRPDRFYGFMFPMRLAPLQAEASTNRNQINDANDLAMGPPLLVQEDSEIYTKGMAWGPNKKWPIPSGTNPDQVVKAVQYPPPPPQAYEREKALFTYADELSGLSAPMEGAGTSSRRTAAEVKIRQQSSGVRASLIAMLMRISSRSLIQFVHKLKQQYATEDNVTLGVPREILGLDYQIDVAGTNDPLNVEENIQEALALYNLLSKDPDIMQNAVARYELKKNLLQATHTRNIEAMLGTEEEAKQRQQQEAQARQMQAQMAMQAAQAGQPPGKPGANGQAAGAPHPPGAQSPPAPAPPPQ